MIPGAMNSVWFKWSSRSYLPAAANGHANSPGPPDSRQNPGLSACVGNEQLSSPDGQAPGWPRSEMVAGVVGMAPSPSPTRGVLGTPQPYKGSLRSAYGKPFP